MRGVLLCLLVLKLCFGAAFGHLKSQDYNGLHALMQQLENLPSSWTKYDDPCRWIGISCTKSRVTEIKLSSMGIKGTLGDDIGQLTELKILDLSGNKDLGGPLPQDIGNLAKLTRLILVDCSFNGIIPHTIGSLSDLQFLDLNSNQFYGNIPPSLGKLSNLYWFDLSNNFLKGPLPVSTDTEPGLDQLFNAKHFHLNKNRLSGVISESLFSSKMQLIHVLFDGNQLSGNIPATIGLLQKIEILRLDRNLLEGSVPSNLSNLSNLSELNLANNMLTGPFPDLSGMNSLKYVDLSNNKFDPSESPAWFSELQSLTTLIIKIGNLHGEVPQALLSLPAIQEIILDYNWFNGTLHIVDTSPRLKNVSLTHNNITKVNPNLDYNGSIMLSGNPFCDHSDTGNALKSQYCNFIKKPAESFSTSLADCDVNPCPLDQFRNPRNCTCAHPYEGKLVFRASLFHAMPNSSMFQLLEKILLTNLKFVPYLYDPVFNNDSYLEVKLKLFPNDQMSFSRSEVLQIGFDLYNQTYGLLPDLGPYNFLASPYSYFSNEKTRYGGSAKNTNLIIGLSVACPLLVALIAVSLYAFKQKKGAKRGMELSSTFENSSRVPKVKAARCFSYDELRKITNGFAQNNEIGSGGYGKVYRGMLPSGQLLAIKRGEQGSMQGGNEFNTEIELLSRVHHKNLATLVGFCSDQEEQMLVYEFSPNGSLRDSLSGKSGVHLDWRRRLQVALGSARGLAYLHELADPPIIHRDVKSSNILLDENLSAKVSDFGLSKLVSDTGRGTISSQVKGTLGYLDPEYYMTQQLTEKSDVYSFGVVMLELITGKRPLEKGRYIVRQVRTTLDMEDEHFWGLKDMIDRRILSKNPLLSFTKFVKLALRCVEETARDRPTMNEVVKEIESMLQNDRSVTNSNSVSSSSSSSTTGSCARGAVIRHPYPESFGSNDMGSSSLEYNGGYLLSTRVEPK